MAQYSQPTSRYSKFGFWLFCSWFFLCVGFYFYKIPFNFLTDVQNLSRSFLGSNWDWAQVFQIELSHISVLAIAVAYLALFLGTGDFFLELFSELYLTKIERWIWSFALGLIFWGLFAEALAFTNLFFTVLLKVLAVLAFCLLLLKDRLKVFKRCWPFEKESRLAWSWKLVLISVLILTLSNLLAPEMSWDAITYQLVLPRNYMIHHGIYSVTGVFPSQYPSLGEMFFSWGLIWGDDSIARFFCFFAHLATALTLVALGARFKFEKAGWYAAAFYGFFPYLNIYSTRGYVDLFVGFYAMLGLGFLIWFALEEKGIGKSFFFLTSIALGSVWAIKYNAVFYWVPAFVIFTLKMIKKKDAGFFLLSLLLLPLFFFGPWAVKSWEYVHNPIFPYLSNWFHSFGWNQLDERASSVKFPVEGWKGLLRSPIIFYNIFFNRYSGAPNEEVGLAVLIFSPLLLMGRSKKLLVGLLTLAGIVPLLFWLITSHQLRLIVPVIALFSLLAGIGFELGGHAWKAHERLLSSLPVILSVISVLYLFQGLIEQPNPFAHFLGFQTREQFLNQVIRPEGYVTVNEYLNEALPDNAKVLILGQQNGYYLNRVSIYDFDYNHSILKEWIDTSASPEAIYKQFQKNDFKYILYNSTGMMGSVVRAEEFGINRYVWTAAELKNYEQFFLKYTQKVPLPVTKGYSLYRVGLRDGFSTMPDFLPGTEKYYLDDMVHLMGLKKASDIVGKSLPQEVYAKAYDSVSRELAMLGYPCFQSAIAELSSGNGSTKEVLEKGRAGLARNGDQATWFALQADVLLEKGKSKAALPFLEKAQSLGPEKDDVARNLSVAYYNEHHLDQAIEEAYKAVTLAPYSTDYRKLLSQLQTLRTGR